MATAKTLPSFTDDRGTLVPVEFKGLLFEPKRLFYVTGVPRGQVRGQHAHREGQQYLICQAGEIGVTLNDGESEKTCILQSGQGILIEKMVWGSQEFRTRGAILLVICSSEYDKDDYITDMEEFERLTA